MNGLVHGEEPALGEPPSVEMLELDVLEGTPKNHASLDVHWLINVDQNLRMFWDSACPSFIEQDHTSLAGFPTSSPVPSTSEVGWTSEQRNSSLQWSLRPIALASCGVPDYKRSYCLRHSYIISIDILK